jgi:hypothetical protein
MDKKQPNRTEDRRRTDGAPLTLDFVLTEVVRILEEERASTGSGTPRSLAA